MWYCEIVCRRKLYVLRIRMTSFVWCGSSPSSHIPILMSGRWHPNSRTLYHLLPIRMTIPILPSHDKSNSNSHDNFNSHDNSDSHENWNSHKNWNCILLLMNCHQIYTATHAATHIYCNTRCNTPSATHTSTQPLQHGIAFYFWWIVIRYILQHTLQHICTATHTATHPLQHTLLHNLCNTESHCTSDELSCHHN